MVGDDHYILFLDDVIRENLQEVFPVFKIHGAWSIKLTRDAEMSIEDEFIGDIAEKIEKQLENILAYKKSLIHEVVSGKKQVYGLSKEKSKLQTA